MAAPQGGRLTSLASIEQQSVTPSVSVATDRHLLGTLGKAHRLRPGILRVFTCPGDVLAAGRWHLAPPDADAAGEAFVRRLSGGRALALGDGFLGMSLLLPHRSALVADDPFALAPFQIPNRYVRGLLRVLKSFGLSAFYPGRDLVTVNRRPIAAVGFETDAEGRLVFEAVLAVGRPLSAVAHLLDRWDASGEIKADLLALEGATCLREEIAEEPSVRELAGLLRQAYAEQFDLTIAEEPLTPLEEQAVTALAVREGSIWNSSRQRRPELGLVGFTGIQTGVLEVHFALEQERFLKEVVLAGDFIANSGAVTALEYGLRLCPAERGAIGSVIETVFADPSNYMLGVGAHRIIAETIVRGLPA
jgi:lipoate-protein ligase A